MLALAGAGCVALGLFWSLVFPIIKLLWTSPFVLVGGGYGFLMLALFYWIIDVKGCRRRAFPKASSIPPPQCSAASSPTSAAGNPALSGCPERSSQSG